jgi:hypothetical protein
MNERIELIAKIFIDYFEEVEEQGEVLWLAYLKNTNTLFFFFFFFFFFFNYQSFCYGLLNG